MTILRDVKSGIQRKEPIRAFATAEAVQIIMMWKIKQVLLMQVIISLTKKQQLR